MKKILSSVIWAILLFTSCEKDDLLTIMLKTQMIEILDVNNDSINTFTYEKKDGYCEFSIITTQIRKEQNVKTINAYCKGDELFIFILLDADLFPAPLDRITQVKFNLYEIPKGKYKLRIYIENAEIYTTTNMCLFN